MNKMTILVIVILVILIGGYFVFNSGGPVESTTPLEDTETAKDATNVDPDAVSIKSRVQSAPGSLTGELLDVSGLGASGNAYVLREDGRLYHYAEGTMPDPAEGSVYEGWLVKREPVLEFFSTGLMEKDVDGTWTLSYEQEGESVDFDFVVITEETVVDDTPEAHIIEGLVS